MASPRAADRTWRDTVRSVHVSIFTTRESGIVVGCLDAHIAGLRPGDEVEFEAREDRAVLTGTHPGDPQGLLRMEYGALLDIEWDRGDAVLALAGPVRRRTGATWEVLDTLVPWQDDVHPIGAEDAFPAFCDAVREWIAAGSPPLAYAKAPWNLPSPPESLLASVSSDAALRQTVWADAPVWLYGRRPAWPEWRASFALAVRKHPHGLFGPLRFIVERMSDGKATGESVSGGVHRLARESDGWRIAALFPEEERVQVHEDNAVLRRGLRTWAGKDED